MKKFLFVLVFGLIGLVMVTNAQPLLKTHVETGDVEGVLDGFDLAVYKAIPYAAPPVGDLRWRAPQPAKAWEGIRVCDTFGPVPPQPTRPGRMEDVMSEDCLYLGIATPAKSASDRLPVMVWIHGGGFQTEWYGGDLWTDQPRGFGMDASQKGAEQQGLAFQKHLKKKNIKQMRKLSAMELCGGDVGFGGFWPCVDGYVICDDQYRLYERGEYNDVPVIVMTNSDEGALFTPGNIKAENYQAQMKGMFGSWGDEALKVYPGSTDDEAWHGNADFFRDMGFAWPSFAWLNLQSKTGKSAAYAAYLDQPSTVSLSQDKRRRGVAHADDVMYLGNTFLSQPDKYPHEAAVAEILQQYWINFAKTGNPNAKGLPYWPSFDESKPTTMQFSNGATLIMRPNRHQIDFVDRYMKAKREETESARKAK